MLQHRFQAKGIVEAIMFIDHLCLNDADLSAAIGQVDQPFVAQLELAFAAMRFIVIKWDQIRLAPCQAGPLSS